MWKGQKEQPAVKGRVCSVTQAGQRWLWARMARKTLSAVTLAALHISDQDISDWNLYSLRWREPTETRSCGKLRVKCGGFTDLLQCLLCFLINGVRLTAALRLTAASLHSPAELLFLCGSVAGFALSSSESRYESAAADGGWQEALHGAPSLTPWSQPDLPAPSILCLNLTLWKTTENCEYHVSTPQL